MANETVRGLCTEMRCDIVHEPEWYADRIIAAHNREMAAKDAEIVKLVKCLSDAAYDCQCERSSCERCSNTQCRVRGWREAIDEVQRVMKEGETK